MAHEFDEQLLNTLRWAGLPNSVEFLDFTLLIRDISRLDRYSAQQLNRSSSSYSLVCYTIALQDDDLQQLSDSEGSH